jgi:hypothetical protein
MSVKLNRSHKREESQKDSNFNGKTIPYPGFEPGTSGLAVGSHNHCTIWVGYRNIILSECFSKLRSKNFNFVVVLTIRTVIELVKSHDELINKPYNFTLI